MKTLSVFFAFAATIPLANWFMANVGTVCVPKGPCLLPMGFGLMASSGVLIIGIALVLRDWLQELTNWKWSLAAVLLGGVLSLATSAPQVAVAAAVAFTVSELFDLAVYTPLRRRGAAIAVMASQAVGAAVDSAIFVYLAFGSFEFSAGTALGKIYAGAAVAVLLIVRDARRVPA